MALFSKPPAKKPDPKASLRRSIDRPKPASARDIAAQAGARKARPAMEPGGDISMSGHSMLELSSGPSSFEVAQANPGLCAVLENAALMFASAQVVQARTLLEQGVQNDQDTRSSPLAWLALFDVLQRADDRAAFDQLALQYVVQFERSPPAWEEFSCRIAGAKPSAGGYIAITGKLSSGAAPLEGLRRAIEKRVAQARLDLSTLDDFDAAGAGQLADALALARKNKMALSLQRPEKLRAALEARLRLGKAAGEGPWLLYLELLQWHHDQATFDERAVDFAVTFEVSPPSWEPPPLSSTIGAGEAGADAGEAADGAAGEVLVWSGVMTGSSNANLAKLPDFAAHRAVVVIDMTAVERIDFVCAGALVNAINRVEIQRRSVQIAGTTPIVRALLLLIGISPRHFVKKAQ